MLREFLYISNINSKEEIRIRAFQPVDHGQWFINVAFQ